MRVYVVRYTDYDYTEIHGVFTTRELAQEYIDSFDYKKDGDDIDCMSIQEFEIDKPNPQV